MMKKLKNISVKLLLENLYILTKVFLKLLKIKKFLKLNIMMFQFISKTFTESNITVLIDKSKEKRGESVFQIPINHDNILFIRIYIQFHQNQILNLIF